MARMAGWLLLLVFVCAGCSGGGSPDGAAKKGEEGKAKDNWTLSGDAKEKSNKSESEAAGNEPAPDHSRKTLAGRWLLMVVEKVRQKNGQIIAEFPVFLVDVSPGKDPALKLVDKVPQLKGEAKVVESKAESDDIQFNINLADQVTFDFVGKLENGAVVGSLDAQGAIKPARLIATEAKSLKEAEPSPLRNIDKFATALQSKTPEESVLGFIKEYPDSPMILDAHEQLLILAKIEKLPEARVREFVESFVNSAAHWGARMQQNVRVRSALLLARTENLPDLAASLLDDAEKNLTDEQKELKEGVAEVRTEVQKVKTRLDRQARLDEATKQLAGADEELHKKARETLAELEKEDQFNPSILFARAVDAEKQEKKDEAIEYYSKIAAWPTLEAALQQRWLSREEEHPLPSETLSKLWTAKNGGVEGLDEHLNAVYRDRLYSFAGEKNAPREVEGVRKTVLLELFTGAMCPPCVAADVALGGIEAKYDHADVIALRYHEHNPGPDPLTNEDSEVRYHYYALRGTPFILVDGKVANAPPYGVGGDMQEVPRVFAALDELVGKQLAEKTTVTLKLSAEVQDGKFALSAEAEGLPEKADELRLRMVLAEAEIPFIAANGVRLHEMVVRSMPGTPKGVAVQADGKLRYSGTVKLGDFKQRLSEYLAAFEEQNPNVDFKSKPLALDKLYFIAMVQNDQTKEVLQSAIVPVSGMIEYPREKAPKVPATPNIPPEPETKKEPEKKAEPEAKKEPEKKEPESKPETESKKE